MCTPIKQCCIYTSISLSTQRLFCVHTVSSICNNPLLTGYIILSSHRLLYVDTGLCVSFCQEFFVVEKVTFWIRTCLHYLIDSMVFLEQLSTIYRTKVGMLYKAILQHDRWSLAVIGADLHTEISRSWHVNFR